MKPHASTQDTICPGFVNVENLPDPAGVDLNGSPRLDLPFNSSDKPEQENKKSDHCQSTVKVPLLQNRLFLASYYNKYLL